MLYFNYMNNITYFIQQMRYFIMVCCSVMLSNLNIASAQCDIRWIPGSFNSHFDNVDSQGNLFLVNKLGELPIESSSENIPIFSQFSSDFSVNSPYLGMGWEIPLLESKFVKVSEKEYILKQPDGWYRMFWKDKKNPHVLNGQGGWKALIKGNTVEAFTECGDDYMKFSSGKLIELHTKGTKLDYLYENDRVVSIKEGSKVILKVVRNDDFQQITLPKLNKEITWRMAPLQNVKDPLELIMLGEQKFVSSVTNATGEMTSYDYNFEQNTFGLNLSSGEQFLCDRRTGIIQKDNEWTYKISTKEGFNNSEIERTNAKGQSEYWYDNTAIGKLITKSKDGTQTITHSFVNGPANGRLRKKVIIGKKGLEKTVLSRMYGADGSLIREIDKTGKTFEVKITPEGKIILPSGEALN